MLPLEFFERLSCMYRAQMMDPWWRWYSEEPGPRRALRLFAGQYAYERQGRASSYPHAADFAIKKTLALDAAEIWRAFRGELDGLRPNAKLNPLYHTGARCNCVCCIFAGDGGVEDVIDATGRELAAGRVRDAFDRLDRVRGVGPKIASFFLRDVAVWFKIEPAREDRELLQPIDVWVRRSVTRLTEGAVQSSDVLFARWICANSAVPEAANQGLWYFGSQIAYSEVRLWRALADDEYAGVLVKGYVDHLGDAVAAWRNAEQHHPDR